MPGYNVLPTPDSEDAFMEYLCAQCGLLLREPLQLYDGQRVCSSCLNPEIETSNRLQSGSGTIVSDGPTDASMIDSRPYFPDRFASEQIQNIRVYCENKEYGCNWSGKVKDLETHLKNCQGSLKEDNDEKYFSGGQSDPRVFSAMPMMENPNILSREKMKNGCPFNDIGCTNTEAMNERKVEEHIEANLVMHLLFLLSAMKNIAVSVRTQIERLWNEVKKIFSEMLQIRESHQTLVAKIEKRELLLSEMQTKIFAQNAQIEEQMLAMSQMQKELVKCTNQIAALRGGLYEMRNSQRQGESVTLPAPVMPPVGSPDHLVSHDGVLLWKITNILQKRQEAILKKVPSILSPPFFTSERGYKLCARLYLNGDGPARGQYLSLFFAVMRGPFDAVLSWPFKQKVTMTLIDQDNMAHHDDSFKPDLTSSSFQRPKTDINVASGSPYFFKLDSLDPHAYIRDDTMFIKITVDTSGLKT